MKISNSYIKQLVRISSIGATIFLSSCSVSHLKIESERAYFDLKIDTFPSQALIYLNGESVGISPVIAEVERLAIHRQKIAALTLFEHQFQQELLLEPGRIPNYININMDIPNKVKIDTTPEEIEDPCLIGLHHPPVLFFDSDIYSLSDGQREILETFACQLALIKNPALSVFGIADQNGNEDYNYQLGLKRAESVVEAMINIGYAPDKLAIYSYGESIVHTAGLEPTQNAFNRKVFFEIDN